VGTLTLTLVGLEVRQWCRDEDEPHPLQRPAEESAKKRVGSTIFPADETKREACERAKRDE
jgi:hypothetical protein